MVVFVPQSRAVQFGLKVGMNWSKYASPTANDPAYEYISKYNMGWLVGGFCNFKLSEAFSIQPEIYYTQIGEKETNPLLDGVELMSLIGVEYKELLDYIQIPVLAKFKVMAKGPFTPILQAGPYLGFLLSGKSKTLDASGAVLFTDDLKQYYRTTDFGLVFSGGLEYEMGNKLVSLEFRYNLGLTNIEKEADTTYITKHRTLMVMVGVGF
jgi:opacity protein-like surface antigen